MADKKLVTTPAFCQPHFAEMGMLTSTSQSRLSRYRIFAGLLAAIAITIFVTFAVLRLARNSTHFIGDLKRGGGFVDYEYQGPRWFRSLLGEENPLKSAVVLTFGPQTTDQDLSSIASLPRVAYVNLLKTKVRGPGLAYLKRLPKLESLELNGSSITDDGLKYLQGLNNLKSLGLSSVEITDDGLERLQGLKRLEVLTLHDTKITDRGLDSLRGLPLESLDIKRTAVTAEAIARLRKQHPEISVIGP